MILDRYRPDDRERLYEICVRTADAGADATGRFADPDLVGHVYLGPYLALEPDLALVLRPRPGAAAEGYLVGTADTAAFERACEQAWWPPLRRRYPAGADYPPADAAMVNLIHRPSSSRYPWLPRYPAHLHIDLLAPARGRGLGRALVERFAEELRARGVPGLFLGVDAQNVGAVAFYRHLGMAVLEEEPGTLVMGLSLADPPAA